MDIQSQKALKVLVVRFANEIAQYEIPLFRGAVIDAVGQENGLLFHNHVGEGFRYAYPMIQYKRIGGKAAIVCVGDGVDEIGKFFSACNFEIMIGERRVHLEVERMTPVKMRVQVWNGDFEYRLRGWLPLNHANYELYKTMDGVIERTRLLERVLVGNILSMCKGVGIEVDKEIVCKITQVGEMRLATFKGVKTNCVDIEFHSNMSLPDFIGIGKGSSLGFGIVTRKKNHTNIKNDE